MIGYAHIHRSLIGHPAFRNDAEAMAFAYLVLRAAWQATRVRYKGKAITLQRGQLAMSVRDLAEAMDRDKGWIERLLKRLKSETMVETQVETGVMVITICNYDDYQANADTDKTPRKTRCETRARQTQDTEQRREELKKEDTPPTPPAGGRERGSKIPEDWVPPAIADLSPQAKACAEQWTEASYATEAEAFVNYWSGESGAHARKSDWAKTWANRIVQIHSKVMRDQKNGNAPTTVPGTANAAPMGDEEWNAKCDHFASNCRRMGRADEARDWEAKRRPITPARPRTGGNVHAISDLLPMMRAQA